MTNPTNPTERLRHLHQTYCRLAGFDLAWTMQRLWQWEAWSANGWGEKELELVIKHLKRIEKTRRWIRSLRFDRFIGGWESIERFEQDLKEAKAIQRNTLDRSDRAAVLRATGRPTRTERPERTIAQIMAGDKALADLLKLRDSL